MQGIFFGAHDDNILGVQQTNHAIEGFLKVGGFAPSRVIDDAVGPVVARIQRTPATLVTEKLVNDLGGRELGHQWFAIKLGKTEASGAATYVADHVNLVANEHTQERGHFQVGVTDGEQARQ
ncbi:MAG: hypothetical protein WBW49_17050, partial [Candidatus Acidiferrum sp.]